MTQRSFARAFTVWFHELERWNVSYFRDERWQWPASVVLPLREVAHLDVSFIEAKKAQQQGLPIISKITFSGALHMRAMEDYESYKGRLFLVKPDRLLFSKINARQGCISYVAPDSSAFVVSSEYPALALDSSRVLGEYVDLALRVRPARSQLGGGAAGMAKPRTSAQDFLDVTIPIPPLETQRAIVQMWRDGTRDAAQARERIAAHQAAIEAEFLSALGLTAPAVATPRKCLAIEWKDLEQWDLPFAHSLYQEKRPSLWPVVALAGAVHPLRETNSRQTPSQQPQQLFNYVGMENVEARTGRLVNFAPVLGAKVQSASVVFDADGVLYGKLRPYLRKVFVPADWQLTQGVASSEFLIFKPRSELNRDFLAEFLRSEWVAKQTQMTTGSRMPRVSAETLLSLQIPLPPLEVQRELVRQIALRREEIARERDESEQQQRDLKARLEAVILGSAPVEE